MLQTLFDSQSSTGLLLLILLLLLAGLVVYVLYKHYYELRVNQHLKTPEKQIINSPDSGMHLGDSLDPDAILVYGLLLSA